MKDSTVQPADKGPTEASETAWDRLVGRARASGELAQGIGIGRVVGFAESGEPLVALADADPIPAKAIVHVGPEHTNREAALAFEAGDPTRPILLGFILDPRPASQTGEKTTASVDGERVELTAEKEIVLRCGRATITLSRDGKIAIRGARLLSRASGTNRIKGGSVQIN